MQKLSASHHALSTPAARSADSTATAATGADTPPAPAETLDAMVRSGRLPAGLTFLGKGQFAFDARAGDLPTLRLAGRALDFTQQRARFTVADPSGSDLPLSQTETMVCLFHPEPPDQPGGELRKRPVSIRVTAPDPFTGSATRSAIRRAQVPEAKAVQAAARHREIEAQLLAQGFKRLLEEGEAPDPPGEPKELASSYMKAFVNEDAENSDEGGPARAAPAGAQAPESASAAAPGTASQPVWTSSARARQRAKERKASSHAPLDARFTWKIEIMEAVRYGPQDTSPSQALDSRARDGGDRKAGRVGLQAPAVGMPRPARGPEVRTSIVVPHDTPPGLNIEIVNGQESMRVPLNLEGHGPSDPRWPRGVHVTSEFLTERRVLELVSEGYTTVKIVDRTSDRAFSRSRNARKLTLYMKQEVVEEAPRQEADEQPADTGQPAALSRQQKATQRKRAARRRAAARQPGVAPAATGPASLAVASASSSSSGASPASAARAEPGAPADERAPAPE